MASLDRKGTVQNMSAFDLVKTIEDDDDVPDFSDNSDEEDEVRERFP
jgi:hypothetical protein